MDELPPFQPQPSPTLTSWLRARLDGRLGRGEPWLGVVPLLIALALGVGGGLVATSALRPASSDGPVLPQAVRVALTTVPTTAPPAAVHVAGAVAHPGLYPLTVGARVDDVVRAAGGLRPDADVARLNLAAPVADGSRVYVPALGEPSPPAAVVAQGGAPPGRGGAAGAPEPRGGGDGPLDLNAADADALEALPGVGPSTAAAIIAHRDEHGPFASVDALEDVPGIGPAKVAALRDHVRV